MWWSTAAGAQVLRRTEEQQAEPKLQSENTVWFLSSWHVLQEMNRNASDWPSAAGQHAQQVQWKLCQSWVKDFNLKSLIEIGDGFPTAVGKGHRAQSGAFWIGSDKESRIDGKSSIGSPVPYWLHPDPPKGTVLVLVEHSLGCKFLTFYLFWETTSYFREHMNSTIRIRCQCYGSTCACKKRLILRHTYQFNKHDHDCFVQFVFVL